ncbi:MULTISPECIES: hypothetical protein [Microcystis]|nr:MULTISPECIES: hypothetical protein [Microcystis]CCI31312.1 hypothetical protein MICAI_1850004 [Microcystis sp. T1-4]
MSATNKEKWYDLAFIFQQYVKKPAFRRDAGRGEKSEEKPI